MSFDRDAFVRACQEAVSEYQPARALTEVVQATIANGAAIDEALGTQITGQPDTLWCSPELTVQRILWPGGSASAPHDHRMWAVVGTYAGQEVNEMYRRDGFGLQHLQTVEVSAGQVICLDDHAVHSVANPSRAWTAGLHVYGGDIINESRSAWRPDGTEVPFADNQVERRAMVQAMRKLAADLGRQLSDDDRFAALTALFGTVSRERRNLSESEAREIVAGAWGVSVS